SHARGEVWLTLGICAAETDNIAAAEGYFQKAIDVGRQLGIMRLLVRGLHSLAAGVYTPRGEFPLAIAADEEALKLARAHNLPELIWSQLTNLTWTCWVMGQRDRTLHWLAELREIALPGTLADGYWYLIQGELAREDGDFSLARQYFAHCRSIAEAGGLPELEFLLRLGLQRLCLAMDDAPAALSWAADALGIVERTGYRHMQGRALLERGRVAWLLEDWAQAEADFRAAQEVLAPLQANFELTQATLLYAGLLHARNDPAAEAVWIEAAIRVLNGGYAFWLVQEQKWVAPLLAHYLRQEGAAGRVAARLRDALNNLPPPPLRVLTLGGFQVYRGGIPIPAEAWQRRKTRQLLLYLLLRRAPVARDELLEVLWPDLSPDSAALALNTTFSELRRILEPQLGRGTPSRYLERDEETLSLRRTEGLWCDVWAFEEATRSGGAASMSQILALYRGDFLPEEPYADWVLRERERLRARYLNVLMAWLEERVRAGAWSEGIELARRILEREPWLEEVWRALMTCLARSGRRSEALHAYQDCVRALRTELDADPAPETSTLYEAIKGGSME
ncbi:MAG TPA: BTAD domain-containing putative transcriptional regulator, partial [Anaerolineae bacterium]|nr:BTAD domain-containing putative transcriptional regulator [Anaerolineae bacterium]